MTQPETIAFQAGAFLLAPLMFGVINKTKAAFAGRSGAPLFQAYFDLWKLLQKGAVYSQTASWVFRAGPMVGLAAVATAMLLTPVGKVQAPVAFAGDLVLFAGLLGLARFMTILAAMDTGSAFEGMGASREALLSAIAEPAFYLALLALVLVTGSLSLSGILGAHSSWSGATAPALVLGLAALSLLLLAENARIPVDDPNTHLELTMIHEVMVLDHSGPDLAFILYASTLKLWLFATLLVGIALPVQTGSVLRNGAVYLGGMSLIAVAVGVAESTLPRLRMQRTPHLLITAGILGALGVTLALVMR